MHLPASIISVVFSWNEISQKPTYRNWSSSQESTSEGCFWRRPLTYSLHWKKAHTHRAAYCTLLKVKPGFPQGKANSYWQSKENTPLKKEPGRKVQKSLANQVHHRNSALTCSCSDTMFNLIFQLSHWLTQYFALGRGVFSLSVLPKVSLQSSLNSLVT